MIVPSTLLTLGVLANAVVEAKAATFTTPAPKSAASSPSSYA